MSTFGNIKNWFREKVGQLADATALPPLPVAKAPPPSSSSHSPALTQEQLSSLSPEQIHRYQMDQERPDVYGSITRDGTPTSAYLHRKYLGAANLAFSRSAAGRHIGLDCRVGTPDNLKAQAPLGPTQREIATRQMQAALQKLRSQGIDLV